MRQLVFVHPHRLWKISEELIAAVPALQPETLPDGTLRARVGVTGDGVTLTLYVPDNAPDAAIAAVVAAHDPTTPSASEARETTRQAHEAAWRTELGTLLVKLEAGTATAAEQRRVAALLVRILLRLLD